MKISILIATYNRSEILKRTLMEFAGLERSGFDAELVIIDNGSNDNTKSVVESFKGKLNIIYMYESESGKSNALNKALLEAELGEIVVFTDDDIVPAKNWLTKIVEYCEQNPEISVFGGRIYPYWSKEVPDWLADFDKSILTWCYGYHNRGDEPCYYNSVPPLQPFGGNFWVRSKVLAGGRLFDRRIGPTNSFSTRLMGEDTFFLRDLQSDCYQILYCPDAIVNHVISEEQMTLGYLKTRAKTFGMARVLQSPFKLAGLYKSNRLLWLLLRYIFCAIGILKRLPATLHPVKSKRYLAIINLYRRIGYDICYIRNTEEIYRLKMSEIQSDQQDKNNDQ